jgi:hypothetical protein
LKPLQEQSLYEILEVPPDAPEAEIVKAWDRVNSLYGPGSLATYTLVSPEEAELLGKRLDEAIGVLLDPEERRRYDAKLAAAPPRPRRRPVIIPPLAARPPPHAIPDAEPAALLAEAAAAGQAEEPVASSAPDEPAPLGGPEAPASPAAAVGLAGEEQPIPLATPVEPIPLARPVEPIPLSTPVPTSPPFAAAAAATPVPLAVVPAPAAPVGSPRPQSAQELLVPEGTRFTGDVLRRAREARGLTVQGICERTKITRYHIENLEADRYEKLPAPVYLRGVLMALAKELRLDGQKVARSYLDALQEAVGQGARR